MQQQQHQAAYARPAVPGYGQAMPGYGAPMQGQLGQAPQPPTSQMPAFLADLLARQRVQQQGIAAQPQRPQVSQPAAAAIVLSSAHCHLHDSTDLHSLLLQVSCT